MATTVNSAFSELLKDKVNLDPDRTNTARRSRNWLIEQIHTFPQRDSFFPNLFSERDIDYGSFARRTKKRPLDDVDIMICLSADGSFYTDSVYELTVTVGENATNLGRLTFDDGSNFLNSRKVINKLIANLSDVPQYENAEIHRNSVAATLKLSSYDWTFDIIPCFHTVKELDGRDYYLIPDGNGNWQKTDPRKDRDRVTNVNQFHNGNALNVIRVIKYWNDYAAIPTMQSYTLENMMLDYYEIQRTGASQFVDVELPGVFTYIANHIFSPVYDPKGIQGDLNNKLDYDQKMRIQTKAMSDSQKANEARALEHASNHQASIGKWGEIFGPEFPSYG